MRLRIIAFVFPTVMAGCAPIIGWLENQRADALFAEIESLTADRSSTSDSECGVVHLACGAPVDFLVYSHTNVNEDALVEKVRQYNELIQGRAPGLCNSQLIEIKSENGICVAVYP